MELLTNAYKKISQYCLSFVDDRTWDKIVVTFKILNGMSSARQYYVSEGIEYKKGGFTKNPDAVWEGLDAAKFLKDHMLKLTGDRIWGLTFTLYPTGKFEIEYDYDKPEDYDDSDETITGEEINQSLYDLGFRDAPTGNDPKGNE